MRVVAASLLAATLLGCNPPSPPGASTIATPAGLLDAPTALQIDGRTYHLETHLHTGLTAREPLSGDIRLVADETEPLSYRTDLGLDCFWVVNGERTWATAIELDSGESTYPTTIDLSGGPRWACGTRVDVVARVRLDDGREFRVLAVAQVIYCDDDY